MLSLLLLSIGLAMDAVAVSLCQGAVSRRHAARQALTLALAFGAAQGVMPVVGWALGDLFWSAIEAFDHWVAFGILVFLGARMFREGSRRSTADPEADPAPIARGWTVALLALATSIDALAVGLTLPALGTPVLQAALTIGTVTLLLSGAAVLVGRSLGAGLGGRAERLGGLLLVGIGAKILIEHGVLGP